jgi:uncharacterized protein YaaW (UPF0174 family)/signal recognition particle receptor subunit beta
MKKTLDLTDIIYRSASYSHEDVVPLLKYLDMDAGALNVPNDRLLGESRKVADHLRKMGSNDIATLFRGEGVPYDEIVLDVGRKLNAEVRESFSVQTNEEKILMKMFEGALENMSENEKRELFRSMGLKEKEFPTGSAATIVAQLVANYSGFAVYRTSLVVANMVSRALLGQGLAFATNATLTRSIGVMLGPIGWIASGLWLAVDLAGPAFRKTVPAVVHVAMLRQMIRKRITIGVVGDGSSGKDSMIQAVFGLPSDIDPVAGSTKDAMIYPIGDQGNATIVNYPGFNDYREKVNSHVDAYLRHTDVFVLVVDSSRGISKTEIDILEKVKKFGNNILICLNKVDMARSAADRAKILRAAEERLQGHPIIETVFDPHPALGSGHVGCGEVYDWIAACMRREGKDADALPKRRDA